MEKKLALTAEIKNKTTKMKRTYSRDVSVSLALVSLTGFKTESKKEEKKKTDEEKVRERLNVNGGQKNNEINKERGSPSYLLIEIIF